LSGYERLKILEIEGTSEMGLVDAQGGWGSKLKVASLTRFGVDFVLELSLELAVASGCGCGCASGGAGWALLGLGFQPRRMHEEALRSASPSR
jgi:hypothetical protein